MEGGGGGAGGDGLDAFNHAHVERGGAEGVVFRGGGEHHAGVGGGELELLARFAEVGALGELVAVAVGEGVGGTGGESPAVLGDQRAPVVDCAEFILGFHFVGLHRFAVDLDGARTHGSRGHGVDEEGVVVEVGPGEGGAALCVPQHFFQLVVVGSEADEGG